VDARPTLIYLLRHGEVAQADPRRFIGHLDVPLSARGEAQCRAQAQRLTGASIAALYTSDLVRARRSGEIIGAPHGLTPTQVPDLREMAMGRWEGLTADEIRAREPDAFADWMTRIGEFPFPEGESVPDLLARAAPAFDAIVEAHAGEAVAIVAHESGTALPAPRPAARTTARAGPGLWRVERARAPSHRVGAAPAQRVPGAMIAAR